MKHKSLIYAALFITLATVVTWIATDRHSYTKFEVVESVEVAPDIDDPLAGTGFYDKETVEKTVRRPEFHLGLFPTPQSILDKHMLSVAVVLASVWGPFTVLLAWSHRRRWRGTLHLRSPMLFIHSRSKKER